MNLGLAGKVTLVTGASRGLGFEIARVFAEEGCHVILNGRDERALERARTALGGKCETLCADVQEPGQCQAIARTITLQHGKLDVLVCNVGSGRSVPPGEETAAEWERVLRLNLLAATNSVEACRQLLKAAGGNIICVSSICGLEVLGAPLTYAAAKAALNSYVKGAARALAVSGIRINAVAPGNLLFEGSVWSERLREDPAGVQAMLDREVALRRLGTPREIADFVAFVASPRAAFATGSVFVVDGGQTRS